MGDFRQAISTFGADAKAKLSNPVARGEPEDQLRAPIERLIRDLAALCRLPPASIAVVGETAVRHLKTRPDFAVTSQNALIGFVELKSPGKGADPNKFKDPHDKQQWEKLQALPNLLYSDGNAFSLWQDGKLIDAIVALDGDVETAGSKLEAPPSLLALFENFFGWAPIAPESAKELAQVSARLCRLLRAEVTEQLGENCEALTGLKADWRKLLFPEATDQQFADSYAQAVTFGLLMARSKEIPLNAGLHAVSRKLSGTSSLIGAALRILTEDVESTATLKTSIDTLTRVLDVVDWSKIRKGPREAWLYFYEDFLDVYDKELRKLTGSYYTPPAVVEEMVRLTDDVLRARFGRSEGLASRDVTFADPAVGTGTFPLGVLKRMAATVEATEGEGAVPGRIADAVQRLIAFELQLGPFAVAQLRVAEEITKLLDGAPTPPLRMFVTDTLSNPFEEYEFLVNAPQYRAIGQSRKDANKVKREEPITVVIGNPPYKEKAKGRGGWVESGSENSPILPPLDAWIPPSDWGVSAHAKHLRNLYVYFWRWATWKVFDHVPEGRPANEPAKGIVCFITVAGFLNGPGFQRMRDYLRRAADEIWVIDCSPEGHQPEVSTRIFQGVQQPVCIVLASRSSKKDPSVPATVRFAALPEGRREGKFDALAKLELDGPEWQPCPTAWRAPLLPAAAGAWSTFVPLGELFVYDGSGVMPGRTWVIAPDPESLRQRWDRLVAEKDASKKETLFHPHFRDKKLGDRHLGKLLKHGLAGHQQRTAAVGDDRDPCVPPMRYAFRSFDRQWIIPDNRLINQPNPTLWSWHSERQIYLTALDRTSPSAGPAVTACALIPDLDHFNGRGGRVFPLWQDAGARQPNITAKLLAELSNRYKAPVTPEDVMAYIAAVLAHPAFTKRFLPDLKQPGLRVPLTASRTLFQEAVELGRTVLWLHTFGDRFADPAAGRPAQPRLPKEQAPRIPAGGAIPRTADRMPDTFDYDPAARRLKIGDGYVENVAPEVFAYEISGKQVLRQWFSYRKENRERPIIGDRRPPSPLGDIQPDHWLSEYTTDLLQVLRVLGLLVALEAKQADLLGRICKTKILSHEDLTAAGALDRDATPKRSKKAAREQRSFEY